jgi:hypothetical protein
MRISVHGHAHRLHSPCKYKLQEFFVGRRSIEMSNTLLVEQGRVVLLLTKS